MIVDLHQYWRRAPFRLVMPSQLLQSRIRESEILLRLGAIANALIAAARALPREQGDLNTLLSNIQKRTILVSHAREAARILNKRHDGLGWTLAENGIKAGFPLKKADFDALKSLLAPDSSFLSVCKRIRDEHGFHVDPKPVEKWIDSLDPHGDVTLHTFGFTGWRFDAAGQVLHDASPAEVRTAEFGEQLILFVRTLPALVAAMIAAFASTSASEMTMVDGMKGNEFSLDPVIVSDGRIAIHINPVRMVLFPFFVGLPADEAEGLAPELCSAPRTDGPLVNIEEMPKREYPGWWIRFSKVPASPGGDKVCIVCRTTPGPMIFGRPGGPCFRVVLSRDWKPRPGDASVVLPEVTV